MVVVVMANTVLLLHLLDLLLRQTGGSPLPNMVAACSTRRPTLLASILLHCTGSAGEPVGCA
jgi:hypothetical protein